MSQAEPAERSYRVSTGVPGFDEILGSGLVPGRFYVVEGEPGTGKTTLALRFALAASGAAKGCSYVADTLIQLRFFEAFGEVRQALSVIKKRTGDHERMIRELRLGGSRGGQIGAPLREFQGVLRGSPTFTGSSLAAGEEKA